MEIKTNEEHTVALRRAIVLLDAKKGTSEDKELDTLVNAIVAYENIHYPIEKPDPLSALEFRLDQSGLSPEVIIPCIGSKEMADKVLAGEHEITLTMAECLDKTIGTNIVDLL